MTASIDHLFQGGAHRGGLSIVRALDRIAPALPIRQVSLADPKPGRAVELGGFYRARGADVTCFEEGCEDVAPRLDPSALLVMSTDTISSMASVVRSQRHQLALVQGVARGPGSRAEPSPVFGLNLAACPGREAERRQAAELLDVLARLSPPASSQVIRDDALSAIHLQEARDQVSEITARDLLWKEQVAERESLFSLQWEEETFSLVIFRREEGESSRGREQALDLALPHRRSAVVLWSDAPKVEFYVVEPSRRRDRGFVRLFVPFERHLPAPARERTWVRPSESGPATFTSPAAFTD